MDSRPKYSDFFTKPEISKIPAKSSLVSDAKHVLDLMNAQAQKMMNEKEYPPPSYGSSAHGDRMYYPTHFVNVKLADLGMLEGRFFAIQDIIELAIRDNAVSSNLSRGYHLILQVRCGTMDFEIQANHTDEFRRSAFVDHLDLFAPISKVPFDYFKKIIDEYMRYLFNKPTTRLTYLDDKSLFQDLDRFKKIETICKNLDKDFNLDINIDLSQKCLHINRQALEIAKEMILVDADVALENNIQMKKK